MAVGAGEPQGFVGDEKMESNGKIINGQEKMYQAKSAPVVDTARSTVVELKNVAGVKKEWNTKNIGQRLGVDAMCAGAAAGSVAPVICMIDK